METHFKNQFQRRIEICEDGLDGTVTKVENFIKNYSNDKTAKLELALKEQIDLIHHLNEKVAAQQAHIDRFGDSIDNGLSRLREDLRAELNSGDDAVKKLIKLMETEQQHQKKETIQIRHDIEELNIAI